MFRRRGEVEKFLAVAEAGRIVAAANRLAIGQPALTRAIAGLKNRFGAPLFERISTGVRLTALGAVAAEQARRLLRAFEEAEDRIGGALAGRSGRIRVTADGSLVTSLADNFLTLVTAFLYHAPLTEGEFGKRAIGDGGFPGTVRRISSWEGQSGTTVPISWPGRGQDVMGMLANGADRLAPCRGRPAVRRRPPELRFEAGRERGPCQT